VPLSTTSGTFCTLETHPVTCSKSAAKQKQTPWASKC